jgi:hypothetical protein
MLTIRSTPGWAGVSLYGYEYAKVGEFYADWSNTIMRFKQKPYELSYCLPKESLVAVPVSLRVNGAGYTREIEVPAVSVIAQPPGPSGHHELSNGAFVTVPGTSLPSP